MLCNELVDSVLAVCIDIVDHFVKNTVDSVEQLGLTLGHADSVLLGCCRIGCAVLTLVVKRECNIVTVLGNDVGCRKLINNDSVDLVSADSIDCKLCVIVLNSLAARICEHAAIYLVADKDITGCILLNAYLLAREVVPKNVLGAVLSLCGINGTLLVYNILNALIVRNGEIYLLLSRLGDGDARSAAVAELACAYVIDDDAEINILELYGGVHLFSDLVHDVDIYTDNVVSLKILKRSKISIGLNNDRLSLCGTALCGSVSAPSPSAVFPQDTAESAISAASAANAVFFIKFFMIIRLS